MLHLYFCVNLHPTVSVQTIRFLSSTFMPSTSADQWAGFNSV